jgi:hypothetical protein
MRQSLKKAVPVWAPAFAGELNEERMDQFNVITLYPFIDITDLPPRNVSRLFSTIRGPGVVSGIPSLSSISPGGVRG